MQPDEELCLCFHVTRRKVENYIRIERPRTAAQLTDCYGAGTGCGWCRTYLKKLFEEANSEESLPTSEEYSAMRSKYVREGKGTPPRGATPVEESQ